MLRFLILALALMWLGAVSLRFLKRLGRPMLRPIGRPEPEPVRPSLSTWAVNATKMVVGLLLVIAFAAALFVWADLPDILVVAIVAPVAGLVSALVTDHWLVDEDDDPDRP